jgi:hypothetical protein
MLGVDQPREPTGRDMTDQPSNWPEPWPDIDSSISAAAAAIDGANLSHLTEGTVTELTERLDRVSTMNEALSYMESVLTAQLAGEVADG